MKRYFFTFFLSLVAVGMMAQPKVYTPTLKSPDNNATSQMPDVSVSWNAITGSTGLQYELAFDTTATFNSPLFFDTIQTLYTGYKTRDLIFGQRYFWKVRAIDEGVTSAWSPTRSFVVFSYLEFSKPPLTDTVQNPDAKVEWKGTVNSVALSGITNIDYQIDTSINFDSPLLVSASLSSSATSYKNVNLRFQTYYYWRIRARHAGGASPWPTGWAILVSGTNVDLASLAFKDAFNGLVVGKSGTILKTTDGGGTWVPQASGTAENLSSIFANTTNTFAVGDNGVILRSTNGGTIWNSGYDPITVIKNLKGVCIRKDTVGYAVGETGTILKTKGIATKIWLAETSGTTEDLMAVHFPVDTLGYAVGANGTIVKKPKQNTAWVSQVSGTTNTLYSVFFTDANKGIAVGANGTILKTINGGTLWSPITINTTKTLFSVNFADANNGYIAGAQGTILKTTNGGTSWILLTSATQNDLHGVVQPNANSGYTVGDNGLIMNTTSNGRPWTFRTLRAPSLTAPTQGQTNQMLDVVLTWGNITGILNYGYEVAHDADFTSIVVASEMDTNFVKATFLRFGVKYYWRVRARHLTDTSAWSTTFNFTTFATVLLKTPANNAQNVSVKPLLVWNAQTGISGYELQLDSLSTFENPIITYKPKITDNNYQVLKRLTPLSTYYWRMRVFSDGGINADTSDWSQVWSFTTTSTLGIEENGIGPFAIYPNPASGKIFVKLDSRESKTIRFTLIDLLGKIVLEKQISVSSGQNVEEILLGNIVKGVYIGKLTFGNNSVNQKIIIE
jgi:photosystem II stability/assembly factor-like uncharacterized protein